MRFAIAALLIVHGLLHLIGVFRPAKAFWIASALLLLVYFTLDEPAFIWMVDASSYFNGETLEDWVIPITDWRAFEGVEVPSAGRAQWSLPSGTFDYFEWKLEDLRTNVVPPSVPSFSSAS